jgi:hypothetical protein
LACLDERLDEPAFIVDGVGNPDVSDDVARRLGNVARVKGRTTIGASFSPRARTTASAIV